MNRVKPRSVTLDRDIAPVSAADVLKWFEEASESRKQKRRGMSLTAVDVATIVKIVNAQRQSLWRPRDPRIENRNEVAIRKLRRAQSAIRTLRDMLPDILEEYRRAGLDYLAAVDGALVVRRHPSEVALQRILDAVQEVPDYLGDPPTGRPIDIIQVLAGSLTDSIRRAWEAVGRSKVSFQTEKGPGIAVLCQALMAITGEEHKPAAVVSCLKRARKRRAGT